LCCNKTVRTSDTEGDEEYFHNCRLELLSGSEGEAIAFPLSLFRIVHVVSSAGEDDARAAETLKPIRMPTTAAIKRLDVLGEIRNSFLKTASPAIQPLALQAIEAAFHCCAIAAIRLALTPRLSSDENVLFTAV
jgi:hypothetical protein